MSWSRAALNQTATEENIPKEDASQRKTHPVFPTSTLPGAMRAKLAPALGGNKADSLHAALPRQRKPVALPLSIPMSNTRAQRLGAGAGIALGDSTACGSPTQPRQ